MIVFLTLCYIGVLFLLVKVKVITLNLWWKLSPIAWVVLLLIAFFIPMQWGAPTGVVNMYQEVQRVIPQVSGEVIEVPVKPLVPVSKGEVLFRIDPRPFEYQVAGLEAQLELAQINLKRAQKLKKTDFAAQVTIDQYQAEVGLLESQLNDARYDLEKTEVRAPANGYAVGVTLTVGQRVTSHSQAGWIAFVNQDKSTLALGIPQGYARYIEEGQSAEVTFKILPGKIFTATVEKIAPATPAAQLDPSGAIPMAPTAQDVPQPLAIILKLEEGAFEGAGLSPLSIAQTPGGAFGNGAIYTESSAMSHIIRKVMLRMTAWINYIAG
jgi:multidrug resistance efflux pump